MLTLSSTDSLYGVAGSNSAITWTLHGDEKNGTVDTFKTLGQGVLTTTPAVVYTPSTPAALIQRIHLVNTTGGAVTVTLSVNGSAAGNRIVSLSIPANGFATEAADGWSVHDSTGATVVAFPAITATGDATGTQSGTNLPLTLATVNGNVGSFGSATQVMTQTVNAKGLTTAAANVAIQIAESQVTNLVTDLAGKQATGNYITAITGDLAASGPGSAAGTLATVNSNVGSFGSASSVATLTANAKGLVTAAGSTAIQIAESQVTNLVTDLAGKQATGNYITALTAGDGTATGPGSVAFTLATVGTAGTKGSASSVPVFVTDTKGRVTSNVDTAIAIAESQVTNLVTDLAAKVPTARTLTTTAPLTIDATTSADLSANRTLAISAATTSVRGTQSSTDKLKEDNLWFDAVADYGFVGNDSTDNLAAFNAMKTAIPSGSTLYFPPGIYRVSGELNLNVDKRITFKGSGRYVSIIKTTSATANIFNFSVAGFYVTWENLGFQSSVDKTAGAAIAITAGNNAGCGIYRCWFSCADPVTPVGKMFLGIDVSGAQSANLSVWNDLDMSGPWANGGRGIRINGSTINVQIINSTINLGASTTSACIEVQQAGSVQVVGCDFIQGTNVVLINGSAGSGAQAAYFTNCFFDQPSGSVVKIVGTTTSNRIKFTQCGIAPTGNNHAVEINGTGAGAVGTATALPAGLSFVDCDIYSQNGTNTGAGVLVNGCQDINVQSCRITGFGGAGGAGVRVIPSASNLTKVRVNGCIIGPNSNLTVSNTTAVELQAGSSGLAALSITDNTMVGNTSPFSDASTMATGAQKNINNNAGMVEGFAAKVTYGATVLTTVDTVVVSMPIPANSLRVGQTFLFTYHDTPSLTTATNVRVRLGTAGTTADTGVLLVGPNSTAVAGFTLSLIVTITAVGAGATTFHAAGSFGAGALAFSSNGTALSVAASSTVANFLTVSIASGSTNTRTVRGGILQALG